MRGNHSRGCDVGGAVLHGHNRCRDWLKQLLERWRPGVLIETEQRVIAWDRVLPVPAGAPPGTQPIREEAELDIRFPQSTGRMLNVDIGFTDPYTRDVAEVRRRAREPGRAAAAYVYHKHARYRPEDNPTEDLVPFILESFGRPSTRAVNFLRQFAPTEPGARSRELRRAYRELFCLTQLRLAELLRSVEDNSLPK